MYIYTNWGAFIPAPDSCPFTLSLALGHPVWFPWRPICAQLPAAQDTAPWPPCPRVTADLTPK